MCFVLRFDVFLCEIMLNTLKKYVLADSRGLLGVKVCLLLFSKSRSLSSRHTFLLVYLTALQQVGLWKKEIQRVSTKSNSLSGRKGCFHNNAGKGNASEPRWFTKVFRGDKKK